MSRKSVWQALATVLRLSSSSKLVSSRSEENDGGVEIVATPMNETAAVTNVERLEAAPVKREGVINLEGDINFNSIYVGENITVTGSIYGTKNVIRIEGTRNPQKVHLTVCGHNNTVTIGTRSLMHHVRIEIGSPRWPCSRARLKIGKGFSIGSQGRLILANSGNVMEIGDHCMFSNGVTLRGGEYPHLLFDMKTGDYLDVSEGIFIGDHVWIGEGAFISKAVTIPSECIVGARSVVTKRFGEKNCVIAGNPARIVKSGVQWVAHEVVLQQDFPQWYTLFKRTRVSMINRKSKNINQVKEQGPAPLRARMTE